MLMNRDIFDVAMNTHLPKIVNQANERKLNNEVVVNRWGLETIEKALKLGSLYKKYFTIVHKLQVMELSELALNHNYYQIEIMKIEAKIKELENDK